jgi:hypothetical protein
MADGKCPRPRLIFSLPKVFRIMNIQTLAWQPAETGPRPLCMVRMGVIAKSLRATAYLQKLRKNADKAIADALSSKKGLLVSERISLGWKHFGYLQHWRNLDDLLAWTHAEPHTNWWKEAINRQRTRQDLTVYHETYLLDSHQVEAIYMNLGEARPGISGLGRLLPPKGELATARGRLSGMNLPEVTGDAARKSGI